MREQGNNDEAGNCCYPGLLGPHCFCCCSGVRDMSWWEPQGLLDPSDQGNQANKKIGYIKVCSI